MPASHRIGTATAPQHLDIDPEEMMRGSPFAIPARPPGHRVALTTDEGDIRSFLIALGIVFGLVAAIGFAIMPGT